MTKAIVKASLDDYAAVINDAHRATIACAKQTLEHAKAAGELLVRAKAALNHGEWLPWLAANIECSERTVRGYMTVAQNWEQVSAKSATVADLTLRGALDSLAKPKADQPRALPKSVAVADLTSKEEPKSATVADLKPPEVEKLQAELEEAHERLAEMSTQQQEMHEELTFLQKVEDAGDQLATALAEVKRLQAEVRILKERINGLMNEKNEAVRAAKMWKAKFEKAERAAA